MTDTHETIADIIAWLRKPREGENAYLTLWRDEIADRLEAALKRERGDAAKLREAVGYIAQYAASAAMRQHDATTQHYIEQMRKWATAALAAPPRNCDRFNSGDCNKDVFDASLAWDKFCAEHYPPGTPVVPKTPYTFWSWVFAPATEQEGGN